MSLVNYGDPVMFIDVAYTIDGVRVIGVRAAHINENGQIGKTGHDQMVDGQQCACGTLNIGILEHTPL